MRDEFLSPFIDKIYTTNTIIITSSARVPFHIVPLPHFLSAYRPFLIFQCGYRAYPYRSTWLLAATFVECLLLLSLMRLSIVEPSNIWERISTVIHPTRRGLRPIFWCICCCCRCCCRCDEIRKPHKRSSLFRPLARL